SYLDAEEPDAAETARVIEEAGVAVHRVPGDISEQMQCDRVVSRAVEEFGRIDVLVNNAAYQMTFDSLESVPADLLEHTFRTNILAMFWTCQAAVRYLPAGASIINASSIQAFQPSPPLLPYAVTKGAIVTFTKGLAQQLIDRGVRVNAVAPGPVWTPSSPRLPEEHTP
ncbi:MAG: SDR family NAD(P)-dependent oxidoreductase, partial [Chloroflexi bacterium]|nr:SDR family NAD(P)-dependent oxidoreductase [Chloroflexota bacterium]